jgi:hypothetical protein
VIERAFVTKADALYEIVFGRAKKTATAADRATSAANLTSDFAKSKDLPAGRSYRSTRIPG